MIYNCILVDVFNIAYRKNTKAMNNNPIMIANAFINYIEDEVKPHLSGNIYLLYDPVPEILKTDLGLSKCFKYATGRQEISSSYKAKRVGNPSVIEAVKLIRKFYTFRGSQVRTCISKSLEADDFVEGIVAKEPGNIALVTNDSDWARYIEDRVHMINKSFDAPYSKTDYFNEFGVMPTIAGVILRKAIYGDETDGVKSIVSTKKLYTIDDLEVISKGIIQYVTEKNISIDEVIKTIKEVDYTSALNNCEKLNPIERFAFNLLGSDLINIEIRVDSVMDMFLDNVRLIKCRCKDPFKYVTYKDENKNFNKLIDVTLNRRSSTRKHQFGKIKI